MQLLTCVVSCKYKCLIATHTKWFMRTFISFLQSNILSLTECEEVIFVAIDFYFDLWQFSTLCSLYKHQPTMTSTFRLNTKKLFPARSVNCGQFLYFLLSLSYSFESSTINFIILLLAVKWLNFSWYHHTWGKKYKIETKKLLQNYFFLSPDGVSNVESLSLR